MLSGTTFRPYLVKNCHPPVTPIIPCPSENHHHNYDHVAANHNHNYDHVAANHNHNYDHVAANHNHNYDGLRASCDYNINHDDH